jgi:uncharacterized protein YkwD
MKKILTAIGLALVMAVLFGMTVNANERPRITNVVQEELQTNDSKDLVRLTITTNRVVDTVWVRHSTPQLFPRARLVNTTATTRTWEISFTPREPGSQYISVEANRGFFTGGAAWSVFVTYPGDEANQTNMDDDRISDDVVQGFLQIINRVRIDNGLRPLVWHELSARVARIDIGTRGNFTMDPMALGVNGLTVINGTTFLENEFIHLSDAINDMLKNSRLDLIDTILNPAVTAVGGHMGMGDGALLNPRMSTQPIYLMYFVAGEIMSESVTNVIHAADPFYIRNLLRTTASVEEAINKFEREVFRLTNIERVNHGLRELIWDDRMASAARLHSMDLAEYLFTGRMPDPHRGSDGSTVATRLRRAGVNFVRDNENTSWGQARPSEVVEGWMNSPGHRRTLLDGNFTHYGGGMYFRYDEQLGMYDLYLYHTQKFATIR